MKLENQVVSLELAKKLKTLGVKQESQFYWMKPIGDNGKPNGKYFLNWKESNDFCDDDSHDHKLISAFTESELGEILKKAKKEDLLNALEHVWGRKVALYEIYIGSVDVNKAAKMLIYLIENGLLPVTK